MTGTDGRNRFVILSPAHQAQLFPALPRHSVVGACLYDVSKGNVTLAADVPAGQWVTAIYSSRGKLLYSVNDRQSGADSFTVSMALAPGFLEMLLQATDKERPEIDSGWTVMSPETRGLAVIWYPLADAAQRDSISKALSRSRCVAETAAVTQ
jgi:uncharacterized membrane protein